MKRKWSGVPMIAIGIALAAILAAVVLLPQETEPMLHPGIHLSKETGFYNEPFYLEMSGDNGKIYYTLDCTEPDVNATLYTGPILIDDASNHENRYSTIQDVCLELFPEMLQSVGITPKYGFKTVTRLIDKATVVRAASIDAFGNVSASASAVYFVGYGEKQAYDGLYIASINTRPENLFDPEEGIYVLGRVFQDSLIDGKVAQPVSSNLGNWPANYKEKGLEWEREAEICIFDPERKIVLSGDYGIRVQGGASRYMLPKSLNIYARKRYGTETIPTEALLGENWQLHTLNLNSGGQGSPVKIHDYLVNRLASDLNVLTKEYEPCALFLDGEYWGVYWLTPRFKEDYFENKYGIPQGDIIETKTDYIEVGTVDDFKYYKSLMRLIGDNDLSDPELYGKVCELTDIDSWIDYYALEIYIANTDWPKNNRSLWRTRRTSDMTYADGKWRWILFDVNLSMDLDRASDDFVQRTMNRDAIFASLMMNEGFKSAIYEKLVDLAQNQFDPERVDAFIREYEDLMADAIENEYVRFYDGDRTKKDFLDECEKIAAFYKERHDYIVEAYGDKKE